jgi:hypothetical protein
MNAPARLQALLSECVRPWARRLPQVSPGDNHAASGLRRESLWSRTATLRLLKT